MSDVLKKPVHLAVLKPTHIQELSRRGKLPQTPVSVETPTRAQLPAPAEPAKVTKIPKLALPKPDSGLKQLRTRRRLKVLYDTLPQTPEDKTPPCDTCVTAACCRAFLVSITAEEYESGLYGDAAVKMTPEACDQLGSKYLAGVMLSAPRVTETTHFLEGMVGEPCPFLQEDNRCGIYEVRPLTCRTYTCVGDSRITEGMRAGTESSDYLVNLYKRRANGEED